MRRRAFAPALLCLALGACGGSSDLPDPCKGNAGVCISLTVKSTSISRVDTLRIAASGAVTGSHDSAKGALSPLPIKLPITLGAPVTGIVHLHVDGTVNGTTLGSGDVDVTLTGAAAEHVAAEVTLNNGSDDAGMPDASVGDGSMMSVDAAPDANLGGCSDVGCGGTCAARCALGKMCNVNGDCASSICNVRTHLCGANACDNGVKDTGETDIDCGGTMCNRCDGNLHCSATTDCVSNICSDTFCQLASGGDAMNGRPLWTTGPFIPQHLTTIQDPSYVGRYDHAAVQAGDTLWILGGWAFKSGNGQAGPTGVAWTLDFSTPMPPQTAFTRADDSGQRDPARAALGADGNIYLFGGFATLNPTPKTFRHSPTPTFGSVWTPDADMPVQRQRYAVANGADGKIYLFGEVSQIDVFTPGATIGTWTQAGQLKAPLRDSPTAVTGSDGKIYIMGGDDSALFTPLATNQVFDINTQSFLADARPMPSARDRHCAVAAPDGRIYVAGGPNGTLVEAFTPSTNTWTTVHPLTIGRKGCAASIAPDGRVVITGGETATGQTDQTEIYGPDIAPSVTSGPRGTTLTIAGSNFASNAAVKIFWGPPAAGGVQVGAATSNGSGFFNAASVTIPATGNGPFIAIDAKAKYPVRARFTVTP